MPTKSSAAAQPGPSGSVGPDAYTRWRATRLGAVTEALEHGLMSELVGDVNEQRLLDLGCGDGLLISMLAARGARVVGMDVDDRMLQAARGRTTRGGVRAHFVQGRIERLPFPDASFDVVIAVTVFCLLPDRAAAIREAVRVLRPGGRLVLGELGRWNLWAARRRLRGWCGATTWRAAHFWTASELRTTIERAGVSLEAVRGTVHYPPSEWAADMLASTERRLGLRTTVGAAFLGAAGTKAGPE